MMRYGQFTARVKNRITQKTIHRNYYILYYTNTNFEKRLSRHQPISKKSMALVPEWLTG